MSGFMCNVTFTAISHFFPFPQCLDWIDSNLSTPEKMKETVDLNRERLGEGANLLSKEQLRAFLKKDIAE